MFISISAVEQVWRLRARVKAEGIILSPKERTEFLRLGDELVNQVGKCLHVMELCQGEEVFWACLTYQVCCALCLVRGGPRMTEMTEMTDVELLIALAVPNCTPQNKNMMLGALQNRWFDKLVRFALKFRSSREDAEELCNKWLEKVFL